MTVSTRSLRIFFFDVNGLVSNKNILSNWDVLRGAFADVYALSDIPSFSTATLLDCYGRVKTVKRWALGDVVLFDYFSKESILQTYDDFNLLLGICVYNDCRYELEMAVSNYVNLIDFYCAVHEKKYNEIFISNSWLLDQNIYPFKPIDFTLENFSTTPNLRIF